MNKIFLDIETTGLNYKNSDIIEICCLKIVNKTKNLFESFHTYLNTKKVIEKNAYNIHKINYSMLKNKPYFREIISKFIKFIYNCKIIVHNANFDIKFINFNLKKNGYMELNKYCCKIVDTLKIARKLYNNKRNSLDAICKRFKILNQPRFKHDAFSDTVLLYKIYSILYLEFNKFKLKRINKNLFLKKNNIGENLIIKIKNKKKDIILNNFFFKIFI